MAIKKLTAAQEDEVVDLAKFAIVKGDQALRDALALVEGPEQRFAIVTMVASHYLAASAGLWQAMGMSPGAPLPDVAEMVSSTVIELVRQAEAGRLALQNKETADGR